jgi:hypothetical protein
MVVTSELANGRTNRANAVGGHRNLEPMIQKRISIICRQISAIRVGVYCPVNLMGCAKEPPSYILVRL